MNLFDNTPFPIVAEREHKAKPFLKWAGGKTQLIGDISKNIPRDLNNSSFTYIEPFVGSGAIFFWMMNNFKSIEHAVINDVNSELVNCYMTIKTNVQELTSALNCLQREYHDVYFKEIARREYYNKRRDEFNSKAHNEVYRAALFIFLNKTCFNGLYRVNSKGRFNVPIGKSKSLPKILDVNNIYAVSEILQRTTILNGDYQKTIKYKGSKTFFYFDPPYRPLNATSNFNSYAKQPFNDKEQERLAAFCEELDSQGMLWMLSNSDMKNVDAEDNYFDDLYSKFRIQRVFATRSINSKSSKRGKLSELLIMNYEISSMSP